ncbi:glycosyltransferase [Acinetobacter bereziniae]|uniref:glycosyltransferase n=1 Tax=Acinetobacter bereziniae TaxID=106648 RepID=UPI00124E76D1|nr:glycosyltransferase [Acinetobacter bereziniae]
MILLDSVYINESGGLILLKYLVDQLEKRQLDVYYLFDNRTRSYFSFLDKSKVKFIENSNIERIIFYKNNQCVFSKVLCFGNVPPPINLKIPVFVYLHQKLFIEIPDDFSLKKKLIFKFKQMVLNYYKKNADVWVVQSKLMKNQFSKKYFNGDASFVEVIPFYPKLNFSDKSINRIKKSFVYVSNDAPHKNHENLISAFCNAYDQIKEGSLTVTVPVSNVNLCELISQKNKLNYPIKNIGFVDRDELALLYYSHEYLIFPSLTESFGLGLAEGIDGGCKVIVSDLPYAYEVCNPSLTFNPYNVESIESAIMKAITQELPESNKVISNDIQQLISLLSE